MAKAKATSRLIALAAATLGFLPNRSIFDQIKLTKLLISYAEQEKKNGAIVALDQEKAYDKITHDYLWKTLKKMGIPAHFTNIIKNLYENANTKIIINGVVSNPFKITRGVRQGDPLSCILFDLAIEPLAEMLRKSTIKGYKVPKCSKKIITTLFADDTTVYLSSEDSFSNLQQVLSKWCNASGAKFNINKTEVIPIGDPEYRESLRTTRKLSNDQGCIPQNIHITKEGEPTRILGAWVGNNADQQGIWSRTLDKIDKSLTQWSKSHPTMEGRKLIIQMTIAGMTQYLTKVQGMPKEVESALVKKIRSFLWNKEGTPPINELTLQSPIAEGGRKVLDLGARNKAIQLTWLKSYLNIGKQRPTWAYIADEIIRKNILTNQKNVESSSRVNPFLQSWRPSKKKLPQELKEMLKTAEEFNVKIKTLKPTKTLQNTLPIWFHKGGNELLNVLYSYKEAKCLT